MSWEDVDLNHSSSVHLRDLGKLVSAFSEKQHSPFEVNADEQLSRFLVPDGVTSQRMSCNSDDQRLNKPSFTHVNARLHEAENILLAEHFNENTREEKITGESPLELASTSDLCEATQEKNSLYLINELCDRLIAKASQSSERNDDYLKTEAISDTPIICAAERSTYSEACEQISYSVPNTYESYYGFIDDNSHLSILNTSHNGSHDSMSVPSEQNGTIMLSIEKTSYATEISGQNCLAKKHQALESNKPTGAISQIQQMVEQLSPPLERIPLTQGPDVISELSHDDTPQCNSLECHDIHDTGGSASATPSPQSSSSSGTSQNSPGKYSELLAVIEELGKDIRPTYAGSKNAAERLKKGIMHARVLVRECLVETDKCARQ